MLELYIVKSCFELPISSSTLETALEAVVGGKIEIEYCRTKTMVADLD